MRKQILQIMVFCAAGLVLGAQGQTSSSDPSAPGSSSSSQGSSIGSPSGSQSYSQHYSPTGRMGQHDVRASKLVGAEIKGSSGDSLGTVSDIILNPSSGKIDFAVISLSSTAAISGTNSSSASSSTLSSSSSSSSGGKLVAVPWALLRSSGSMGSGSSAGATASSGSFGSEQSFVFTGDKNKLMSAPAFDQSNWPNIGSSEWRHSIYSYYGVQPGSFTGGATSPGGTESSSGSSSSSSSGTSPSQDSSSPSSSTSPNSSSSTSPDSSSSSSSSTGKP